MIQATPADNLQAKLDEATNSILELAAGVYTLGSMLRVHTGTTIIGDPAGGTKINGTLSSPGYLFEVDGNSSGVTFENLDATCNHGLISLRNGSGYKNITITNCRFQHGGGTLPDGTLVFGLTCTIANSGTLVKNNLFHDSTASVRSWCWFNASDSHFDNNTYQDVQDGGQLQFPGSNVTYNGNYATGLCNKLQEGDISNAANFEAIGNVAYAWQSTNPSSMGLSLLSNTAGSPATGWPVTVKDNFIDLSLAGRKAGGTSGVVVELGGGPLTCADNIFGGASAPGIIQSDTPNSIDGGGNQCFGPTTWGGARSGEGGPAGNGTWTGANPTYDANLAHMPPPPANINSYLGSIAVTQSSTQPASPVAPTPAATTPAPATASTPAPATPTVPAISGLTATSNSPGTVQLKWSTPLPAAGEVTIISTEGRQAFPAIALGVGVTGAILENVHPGWMMDFQVTSGADNSATVSVPVKGVSSAAYTGTPTLQPASKSPTKKIQTITLTTVFGPGGVAGPQIRTSKTVTTYSDGSSVSATP